MSIEICLHNPRAVLPTIGSDYSAGLDLYASEHCVVKPGGRVLVNTGLSMKIPVGCYGRIASRSGLAVKYGIEVGAGVIDSDYRGVVHVLIYNHGNSDFDIPLGFKIAQIIIEKIKPPTFKIVKNIGNTSRGDGGFGSTGNI